MLYSRISRPPPKLISPDDFNRLNISLSGGRKKKTMDILNSLPNPDLTTTEMGLLPHLKNLRIILKKCAGIGKFDFLDVDTVVSLATNEEPGYLGQEGEVVFHGGDGPELFHLMWFENCDKAHLISRWLTDKKHEFEDIKLKDATLGLMVAAFYGADGVWYRAVIINHIDKRTVRVQYIDYGNSAIVPFIHVKRLPNELNQLQSLCFPARLLDINPYREPLELENEIKANFVKSATLAPSLKARAMAYDREKNVWDIFLWQYDPFVELNETVREAIRKKRDTPEVKSTGIPASDLNKMISSSHEVNIREYREVSFKGLRNYRITHVVSPSEFSVEYFSEIDPQYVRAREPWRELMQNFYNDSKYRETYKMTTSRVYVNRCYAWKNPENSRWERVRVISVLPELRACDIHVLDIGFSRTTTFEEMFELCTDFVSWSALTCSAFLVDILPPGGLEWPPESIEAFRNLAIGKIYHGIVLARDTYSIIPPNTEKMNGKPETTLKLGLILMDKDKDSRFTLNAQLCQWGLAEPNGLAGGRTDLSADVAGVPSFDVAKYKLSLENNGEDQIIVPINSTPSTILTGIFPAEYEKKGKIPFILRKSREQSKIPEDLQHMPTSVRRRLGVCSIIRVVSPGCFYLQSVDKIAELEQMMANLRILCEQAPEMDVDDIVDGALIAVRLTTEEGKTTWNRGIIRQHLVKISLIKVILVDFGGSPGRTRREYMRALPPFFASIPAFSQRVHLDAANLGPLGNLNWAQGAKDIFRKYINCWEPQVPVYYIWRPRGSVRLELDEFDQPARFNSTLKCWENGVALDFPLDRHLRKVKNHVMLYNLYCSLGVDIAYEIFTDPHKEYKFSSIWDLLHEKGYAVVRNENASNVK